jgi:hypothetical protein
LNETGFQRIPKATFTSSFSQIRRNSDKGHLISILDRFGEKAVFDSLEGLENRKNAGTFPQEKFLPRGLNGPVENTCNLLIYKGLWG